MLCIQRTKTTSWSITDTTLGKYRNFAKVVQEFGGWQSREAVNGALEACTKCMMLGGNWLKQHPQAKFQSYLILDFEHTEKFKTCWSSLCNELTEGTCKNKAPGNRELAPEVPSEQPPEIKPKSKAKAKSRAKGKSRPDSSPAKVDPGLHKTVSALWKDAKAVKASYHEAPIPATNHQPPSTIRQPPTTTD